jgi:hypothetical protein
MFRRLIFLFVLAASGCEDHVDAGLTWEVDEWYGTSRCTFPSVGESNENPLLRMLLGTEVAADIKIQLSLRDDGTFGIFHDGLIQCHGSFVRGPDVIFLRLPESVLRLETEHRSKDCLSVKAGDDLEYLYNIHIVFRLH